MPRFGACCGPDHAKLAAEAGFDYAEAMAAAIVKGEQSPDDFPLPVEACNCLLPVGLHVVGPDADPERIDDWFAQVMKTLGAAGVPIVVFGGGGNRAVPYGFDRGEAHRQLTDAFARAADHAGRHGLTVAVEPLRRAETNIVNTVGEAMEYVREVDSPSLRCLVDSYHFWTENDSLDVLAENVDSIEHVHVADLDGRTAPGQSGTSDYVPFFRVLKAGGYDGRISIEGTNPDAVDGWRETLRVMTDAWAAA